MKTNRLCAFAVLLFTMAAWLAQSRGADTVAYKTGYSALVRVGRALYDQLNPNDKALISEQPISFDVAVTPFARMMYLPAKKDGENAERGVWISAGFSDLVDHVAHAMAIDKTQKGYFQKYIAQLITENGEKALKPLPGAELPKFWTEDMLNEQRSNFDSIIAIVVATKIAHHTLGHYDKYQDQLREGGRGASIADLVTEKEWEDAYREGLLIALGAGYFTEGVVPFYEALDKAAARPAWASDFLPAKAKFGKMKKDFVKYQEDYLSGRLKRPRPAK